MNRIFKSACAAAIAAGLLLAGAGGAPAIPGEEVRELIEGLEVGEPVYYENLTIIPVYTVRIRDHTRYTTLDEALEKGWLEIAEVEGGRVPKVRMRNRTGKSIFVMGGEVLTGGRQDRIVGRDVLLAPKVTGVIVPVYCVEQGRWTYESEIFHSKRNLGTARLRAEGQKAGRDAQGRIWGHVSGLADRVGAASPTSRFQEAYESEPVRRRISEVKKRMDVIPRLWPDAIGAVIGVGKRITSVDIFANPHVFKRMWPKLLRSAALAAFCDPASGSLSQADAVRFLRRVHGGHYVPKPAVSLGRELSALDREINVNALIYGSAVIHLAAFPEDSTCRYKGHPDDSERRIRVMKR